MSAVGRKTIVFCGSHREKVGDVEALPLEDFLDELPSVAASMVA